MDVVNTKERGQAVLDLLRTRAPMRVRETQGPDFELQNWTVSSTYTWQRIDTGPAMILRMPESVILCHDHCHPHDKCALASS